MLGEQLIEGLEVSRFLVIHMLHQGAQVGVRSHDWRRLRRVDQGGGKLAGLINPQLAHASIFLCFRGVLKGTYGTGEEVPLSLCERFADGGRLRSRG